MVIQIINAVLSDNCYKYMFSLHTLSIKLDKLGLKSIQ